MSFVVKPEDVLGCCVHLSISYLTVYCMSWSPALAEQCVHDSLDQGPEVPSFNLTYMYLISLFLPVCIGTF
jgi:hypothetical protein